MITLEPVMIRDVPLLHQMSLPNTPYIQILRGRGRDGMPGPSGPARPPGRDGSNGKKGDREEPGPRGPRNWGVVFTRWGQTTCPTTNDTERLYQGKAAGSSHNEIEEEPTTFVYMMNLSFIPIQLVYLICSLISMELSMKLIKTVVP